MPTKMMNPDGVPAELSLARGNGCLSDFGFS
jgi:hypothetical protein